MKEQKPVFGQVTEITIAHLQVVVMPNGEIICKGKTVGWVDQLGKYLSKIPSSKA